MTKFYILGGLSCISGIILLMYQALSSLMTAGEVVMKRITLMDVIDAEHLQWVENISIDTISSIVNYILSMSLSYLLIGIGILFFIIGGIVEK